jgi:small GTP-binding protein
MSNIKIILLGEAGVGKTNLINVAIGHEFDPNINSTLNTTFIEQQLQYNNKTYTYTIWDTAGQEMYRSLNKIFMKGAKIVIIVYSIETRKSFEELNYWIDNVKETLGDDNYVMAIVANKADLFEDQVVSDKEGKDLANKYKIKFCLTSAKDQPDGFKKFLTDLIKEYINLVEPVSEPILNDENNNNIQLSQKKPEVKKRKCC